MWDNVVNFLTSVWNTVSEFCVSAYNKAYAYVMDLFEFLKSYLGSEIMAYVTLGIIGLLAVLLIILLPIAIANPAKRKKKKLKKALKKQEEYESLRKKIADITEEINKINLDIILVKKNADDSIFKLREEDKLADERDALAISQCQDKIDDLAEKQILLGELLKKQQSGIFKAMNKEKAENTKQLMDKIAVEQTERSTELAKLTEVRDQRKEKLTKDIEDIVNGQEQTRNDLIERKATLELEKEELSQKLNEMEEDGERKLSIADVKIMTDEFARQKRLDEKESEDKVLEELRIAKESYELARQKRIQAEKDKLEIVENVKKMQEKQRFSHKNTHLVSNVPVTVNKTVRTDDKPDDVNIIIADLNSETVVFAPVEPIKEEHVYQEPEVSVVDIKSLPEDEVIFIEAYLDDLWLDLVENNSDGDTILDSPATNEKTSLAFDDIPQSEPQVEEIIEEPTQEVACTQEPVETEPEEVATIDIEPTSAEPETPVASKPEVKPEIDVQPKKPVGKIYNDGIPATPINKKSKYQKPLTKMVKKDPSKKRIAPIAEEVSHEHTKIGYNGKWLVVNEDGKFSAKLLASNGGFMIKTPDYASVSGLKASIENIKKSLAESNVSFTVSKDGKHSFKVLSQSGRVILKSEEYNSKHQCEKALESTKRFAETAIIIE